MNFHARTQEGAHFTMPATASHKATRATTPARPPIERLMAIHADIARKGFMPNAKTLAPKLGVSPKTIQRDLAYMRDHLGLPIEYDIVGQGFFYSKPVDSFPALKITEGELFALLVAQQAIQLYKDTPYTRILKTAFKKLASTLTDKITFRLANMPAPHPRRAAAAAPCAPEDTALFQLAAKAVLERIEVTFDYQAPGTPHPTRHQVQPLHLLEMRPHWHLIAHDQASDTLRVFTLSHMSNFVFMK